VLSVGVLLLLFWLFDLAQLADGQRGEELAADLSLISSARKISVMEELYLKNAGIAAALFSAVSASLVLGAYGFLKARPWSKWVFATSLLIFGAGNLVLLVEILLRVLETSSKQPPAGIGVGLVLMALWFAFTGVVLWLALYVARRSLDTAA